MKLDLIYLKQNLASKWSALNNGDCALSNTEDVDLLKVLIVNALRLYSLSRAHTAKIHEKAMHPGDHACLVAVDALLTLGPLIAKVNTSTLQALCLLDVVLTDNKHNFLARTQLAGLLQTFNLYALASQAYQALDVKEILHETMSPLLFLRIGAMHAPTLKGFNSYDAMTKALEFYSKSLEKIPDYQSVALDHANYSQVIHMHQFREQLSLSPTRLMLLYERKRLARLLHDQIPGLNNKLEEPELADQLRNAYTGSAELPKRAQPDRHPGPPLTKQYNEWLMVVDLAFELARSKQPTKIDVETSLHTFTRLSKLINERGIDQALTETELSTMRAAEAIFSIILYLVDIAIPTDMLDVNIALETLQAIITSLLEKYSPTPRNQLNVLPHWTDYHGAYLSLELCQVLDALMTKLQKAKPNPTTSNASSKIISESAKSIKTQAQAIFDQVQRQFSSYKKDISGYGNADLLQLVMGGDAGETEDVVAEAVYEVMGVQNVRRFLQSYVSSAKVAVDAVLSVKLKK